MISDDDLRSINPEEFNKACWIKPDGSLVQCVLLHHFSALGDEVKKRYDDLYLLAVEQTNEWADSFEPDEHIPWHMVDDEFHAARILMNDLAEEGYIRCALMRHRGQKLFEMETTKATLKKHDETIRNIIAGLDIDLSYFIDTASHRRVRFK